MYDPFEPIDDFWEPQLYVYEASPPEPGFDDAGLVMSWGPQGEDGLNWAGAWQYVYPVDPNLTALTLNCAVVPPQFNASGGQVTSVGLGLVDALGFTRTWVWNVGAAASAPTNTIAYNQQWNVTIGPIAPPIPPAPGGGPAVAVDINGLSPVTPIFFNNPAFNPATVVSIIGIESGRNVGAIPPPPAFQGAIPIMWNWWGGFNVVPEPTSFALLLGASFAFFRRRRS
jgi:hypothetical protein